MKRNALHLLVPLLCLVFQASGVTVFSNLDTADNRVEARKTTGKERVRYNTFWNADALAEDHLTRLSTFALTANFFRGETPRDGVICRESSRIASRNAV